MTKEFVLDTLRVVSCYVSTVMAIVITAEATKVYKEMYF